MVGKLLRICRSPSLRYGPLYTVRPFQTSSLRTYSGSKDIRFPLLSQLTSLQPLHRIGFSLIKATNYISAAYSTLLKFLVCNYTHFFLALMLIWFKHLKWNYKIKTFANATCTCSKRKKNISKQATKHGLKWQKQLKDDILKVITVHLVWRKRKKKKEGKADHTHRHILKMKATAVSQKDERKKRIKNYTTEWVREIIYTCIYIIQDATTQRLYLDLRW